MSYFLSFRTGSKPKNVKNDPHSNEYDVKKITPCDTYLNHGQKFKDCFSGAYLLGSRHMVHRQLFKCKQITFGEEYAAIPKLL